MLRAMWRKLLRAIGCLSYFGMLGVIFALVAYVAFSQFVRRGVTPTPELFGLPEEEAAALLADQGLRLAWSEMADRYDETVPAGHVLMQKPGAGTLVKRGSTITVILSRGPQLIEVPSVVGTALQAAQVTLAAAGLTMGQTLNVYSDRGLSGVVVAQVPPGGTRVERAAAVDVFLSLESRGDTFLMPDLVDHSYDEVREFFSRRGFRLGRVSYEPYAGIAPGTVLRHFPQAGHPLHRDDVIALSVVAPEVSPEPEISTAEPAPAEPPPAAEADMAEVPP